ncbi:glycoside hydrolase family 92 protein [Pseudoalteromonas sp. NEC-BIFX-2020_015]|uniref:GH92 family glycosyl hydrolase n=1 Tax=Pseudoalteromonas sp. NEC-BIFX-2020_015 TaxID=2729544 RepID=UPI0014616248|nr:GH92 family glycosyl hydrolase [Pseudoalteromonas sp. NEC-BIFX-2020_015]NMR27325.1 glycoside hydrolase family 92 protein [Pseudoalteromonas sp. NEC-BIFX-2020_015]
MKASFYTSLLLCGSLVSLNTYATQHSNTQWVDTFIGTGGDGHLFPGAVVPFGMVQLSPDTDNPMRGVSPQPEIYKRCAGYHYDDHTIVGFSHTHFSGTGHSDLGDLLIMPMTGEIKTTPGSAENPEAGYRSRFSHDKEWSEPGYYGVELQDYNITAQVTASQRVGMHKYTFNDADAGHVLIDLTAAIYNFENKVIWSDIRLIDDHTLVAYRATNGWANNRQMYFAIEFSKPISDYNFINEDDKRYRCMDCLGKEKHSTIENKAVKIAAGKAVKFVASFDGLKDEPLYIKVGLSAVSRSNALENLKTELPHWDFDKTRADAKAQWATYLDKVDVEGTKSQKRQFYTALYHALQAPNIYQDVNGQYRGVDGEIHEGKGFEHYTLFSLWDTYRALHPLLTIIDPDRVSSMVQSMLVHYQQSYENMLPIWSFHGHETWTMIGYHAVSVIADAYLKGIRDFDIDLAVEATINTANNPVYDAIPQYKKFGYVPMDVLPESVSITLEYAYDDFAIAQMFNAMGKKQLAKEYYARAMNYKNVFDKQTGYMRGKDSKGNWNPDFNPEAAKYMGPFTEGNSNQYSFYVPHDVAGLIDLMGGDDKFEGRLDALFDTHLSADMIKEHEDIAGLIGNYAHGNEPSHHIAYLYNYAGKPWRTQERIRQIMDTLSSDKPDGLAGNDDVGQMSAWYIFSAMGFYPVAPGDLSYAIGAPQVEKVTLKLAQGKSFTTFAKDISEENLYIQSVTLNGKPLTRNYLMHAEIINGGELRYQMGDKPNKTWGTAHSARPPALSKYKG